MKETLLTVYPVATVTTLGIPAAGQKQPTFGSSTAAHSAPAVIENPSLLKSLIAHSSLTRFSLCTKKGSVGDNRMPYSRKSSDLRALLIHQGKA